jgi:hypothetical protein
MAVDQPELMVYMQHINSIVNPLIDSVPATIAQAQALSQNAQLTQPITGASLSGTTSNAATASGVSTSTKNQSSVSVPTTSTTTMQNLANTAADTARRLNSNGWCAKGVYESLTTVGLYSGPDADAKDFGDLLSQDSNLQEIQVASYNDLLKLPAGCIIQWAPGGADPSGKIYGHITITDGHGGGNSDHYESTLYNLGSKYRVFVPKK